MERELEIRNDLPPGAVSNMVAGVWEEGFREYNEYPKFKVPRIYYTNSEGDPAVLGNYSTLIDSEAVLEQKAKNWANIKFKALELKSISRRWKVSVPTFSRSIGCCERGA